MIQGTIAAIQGSPKSFIFVLQGTEGVVQIDMDLVATKRFAKEYEVEADDPKELLKALSKKVMGKKVEISFK